MLVYCGQTAGSIKMPLSTEVGLSPGHIVLDGNPAPPAMQGGTSPPPPTFRPTLLWHGRPSQQLLSSCLLFYCSDGAKFLQTVADLIHTARRDETRRFRRVNGAICALVISDYLLLITEERPRAAFSEPTRISPFCRFFA